MAVISPWTGAGDAVAQQVRQRIVDQLTFAQKQQDMDLANRRQAMLEQEAQQRADEHQQTMAERAQQNAETEAAKGVSGLAPNQSIPDPMAKRISGTMQAANMKMNPPLAQPPNMPDMMQPDIVPGEQPGAVWMGNDQQRTDEEKKYLRGKLMTNPNLTNDQRLGFEAENAGLKVPPNMWEQKAARPGVVHDTPQGLMRIGDDNGVTPVLGPDGKPVQGYHPPQQSHFQLQPEVDPVTGKQTGRFLGYNSLTNAWEPVKGTGPGATKAAPGAAQTAKDQADATKAAGAVNQVDQSLDSVKDLVGPAAGRGETVEQWLGNADPRIQAFGTKLLMAKLIIDKSITGSARAGASGPLLAKWDNLLSNKVSYEGMKAALQAAREILGAGSAPAAGGGGRVYYDENGNQIKR